MKKIIVLSAAIFLAGCGGTETKTPALSQETARKMFSAVKMFELYSWQSGGDWSYALIDAGKPLKTFAQITRRRNNAKTSAELLFQLSALAAGEEVYWNLRLIKGFSYPPEDEIQKITAYCKSRSIRLEMIGR